MTGVSDARYQKVWEFFLEPHLFDRMNQGEYKYLKISKHKDSTDDWS